MYNAIIETNNINFWAEINKYAIQEINLGILDTTAQSASQYVMQFRQTCAQVSHFQWGHFSS